MQVTVKLFAMLREHIPECDAGVTRAVLPEGAAVQDALAYLHIPADMPIITLVNGVQKSPEDMLHEGDTLSVFPPIAGG